MNAHVSKRFSILVVIIAFFGSVWAANVWAKSDLSLYKSKKFGFEIRYPKSWQPYAFEDQVTFQVPQQKSGFPSQNLNIYVKDLKERVTSQAFAEKINLDYVRSSTKELQEKQVKLGGRTAYRATYVKERDSEQVKTTEVYIATKKKGYMISYTASSVQFDKDIKKIEQILQSVKVR